MVEIYIDNTLIDTSDVVAFPLNYSIADIREPSKRQQSFSKTISLPSSKENDKIFTHYFDVNQSGGYDPNLKADCDIYQDNILVFSGYAQLKKVTQKSNRNFGYDVVVYGKLSNIFFDISRGKLSDLDFSEFDHDYTKTIQANSWDTSIIENSSPVSFSYGNGYVYPLIDYGYSTNQVDFKVTELKPALYLKTVIDKIFDTYGYTYDSTFFDSATFKRLIIPFTRERLEMDNAAIEDKLFQAGNSTKQEIAIVGNTTSDFNARETVEFDDDSTGANFDNGGNYDTTAFQYTVPDNGIYSFNSRLYTGIRLVPDTPAVTVTPTFTGIVAIAARLLINGTPINSQTINIDFSGVPAFSTSYESANTITQPDPNGIFLGSQFSTYSNLFTVYFPGITLTAGDEVEIEFYLSSNSIASTWSSAGGRFIDGSLNLYDGDYYIQMKTGSTFYNKVDNTSVIEGGTVNMSNVLPLEIEQKDLLSSVIKMFNLYVEQDATNERNYFIEPRNDFYSGASSENWEFKLDDDSDQDIIPMGVLDAARYKYSYKEDKDYYNSLYTSTWGEVYGEHIVDVNNDFLNNEKKTEIIFSPTPLADNGGGSDMVMSRIFQVDGNNNIKPYAANIRLLYYDGLKTIQGGQWNHNGQSASTSYFTYPYAGHLDDPFNPSYDLNFGIVKEVYYDDIWQPLTWSNANLYNNYHSRFIEEITDSNSILFTGFFELTGKDVYDIDFRNQYWFKNAYWRLNKVIDYDPNSSALTKCEFVKVKDAADFSETTAEVIGGGDGYIYVPPKMKTKSMTNDNSFEPKMDIAVRGSNNVVAPDVDSVMINGDNNKVHSNTENIVINGDGNIINAGLSNITLINSDNLEIFESDVTYINGFIVGGDSIASRDIQTLTTDGNMGVAYRTTLCDTSSNNIGVTLPPAANVEKYRFTIKKIASANTVTISSSASDNIDGSTSITITSLYDSVELESDGTEYNIV